MSGNKNPKPSETDKTRVLPAIPKKEVSPDAKTEVMPAYTPKPGPAPKKDLASR